MSQPSLREKFDDEELLSTVLAVELEVAKKTLAEFKLEKSKPLHIGPFSLNLDYYIRKMFEELDNRECRLQKLGKGEQLRDWNFYKIIWKL